MNRVLIVEPYYGGSHKLFLQGLQQWVDADYTLLTLPARKWKMRMQLSALWFVEQIELMPEQNRFFDTVLSSTFVDVAVFRALVTAIPGWNRDARINTYFHENQFAYPGQAADPTMRQFTAINFTTALASDACAFNSHFNMESFIKGLEWTLKKATDMKLQSCVAGIREKSVILYPGMDYSAIDQVQKRYTNEMGESPVIVWNHRWEHDKGPENFFEALYHLQNKGVRFRLIVLGESFINKPQCFEEAASRFENEIIHFGYAQSRDQYAQLLQQGDIIVSTAKHEFFGISVLEGIRAGCYPLLPDDLSYPELYDEKYRYGHGKLCRRLKELLRNPIQLEPEVAHTLTSRFDWDECKDHYYNFLFNELSE